MSVNRIFKYGVFSVELAHEAYVALRDGLAVEQTQIGARIRVRVCQIEGHDMSSMKMRT